MNIAMGPMVLIGVGVLLLVIALITSTMLIITKKLDNSSLFIQIIY